MTLFHRIKERGYLLIENKARQICSRLRQTRLVYASIVALSLTLQVQGVAMAGLGGGSASEKSDSRREHGISKEGQPKLMRRISSPPRMAECYGWLKIHALQVGGSRCEFFWPVMRKQMKNQRGI